LPIRRVFPEAGTVREARKMKILHCTAQSFFGRLIAAALSLATCTHTAAADEVANVPAPSPDKLERITDFFTSEVATGKLPGAVVLIQQHGKPVYLKCFGVQDVATGAPMTANTIFALHSMTKPITSVAAMMLIDAGKLSPADPVSKFIPDFADAKVLVGSETTGDHTALKFVPADRPVTIMDLMRHTSGITYDYIGGKLIMKAYSESGLFDGH
jgi:CubicO group peptidase (beta-lactamase class C family)